LKRLDSEQVSDGGNSDGMLFERNTIALFNSFSGITPGATTARKTKTRKKTRSMFLEIQIETAEITQTGSGQTYGNSDANFCGLLSVGSHATIRLNDFYGQGTEADGACVHVHIKQQNGT
jgi:hypothetical protein